MHDQHMLSWFSQRFVFVCLLACLVSVRLSVCLSVCLSVHASSPTSTGGNFYYTALQELAQLLYQLKTGGHKALIFTQMTKMLDVLEAFLNLHGYTYLRLDGTTKPEQRQASSGCFAHVGF